jgi:hypothetical protein
MDNRMKAALIGGVVAGALSALLGAIPVLGICCFLWALGGGFLAVFIYLKGAPGPMTPGEGAKLGLRAGIIGAIIYLIIALPLMLLWGGAAMMSSSDSGSAVGAGVVAGLGSLIVVVAAVVIAGFTVLGSVIGAAVLGKGAGAAPPPPPPPPAGGFGGPGM